MTKVFVVHFYFFILLANDFQISLQLSQNLFFIRNLRINIKQSTKTQLYKLISVFILLIMFCHTDLAGQKNDLSDIQGDFVYEMLPVIRTVNAEITGQRNFATTIIQKLQQQTSLSDQEKSSFISLLKYYRMDANIAVDSLICSPECLDELFLKIDIIPEKIALAQAAIESSWGRSRFAREGNSYFGIRCRRPGCGIEPEQAKNEGFYVKKYSSLEEGVRHYAKFLNAGRYYNDFRQRRKSSRLNGNTPDPLYIVEGLSMYSARREAYIKSLKTLIMYNFKNL